MLLASSPGHQYRCDLYNPCQIIYMCIGLPPACARSHRTDGPTANHALSFELDHASGSAHCRLSFSVIEEEQVYFILNNKSIHCPSSDGGALVSDSYQAGIITQGLAQFVMRSSFDNHTFVHHRDPICITDSIKPMRNYQGRTIDG